MVANQDRATQPALDIKSYALIVRFGAPLRSRDTASFLSILEISRALHCASPTANSFVISLLAAMTLIFFSWSGSGATI